MADCFTKEQRSEVMRRVKSSNTKLELKVRSALHGRGLRYRLRSDLPGKPDLVFVKARIAVFIDSCFWHGCPEHCRMPANNREYWQRKISRTVERDKRMAETYKNMDWVMHRIWEHDIKQGFDDCIDQIEQLVRSSSSRKKGAQQKINKE
jgi:DNA mismatch endonuclease (patch repair protein)